MVAIGTEFPSWDVRAVRTHANGVQAGNPLLAAAFDAAPAFLIVLDRQGTVLLLNAAARVLFPESGDSVIGRSFWAAMDSADGETESLRDHFLQHAAGKSAWQLERIWVDPLGDRHRIAWTCMPILMNGEPSDHVISMGVDVTDQRKVEAVLRQRAETDPLTGLPNRASLEQTLPIHLDPDTGLGCGLLFCDLDGFKGVNDGYGHHAGDDLLVQVAGRLNRAVRGDDYVARVGGDEFVILLPGVGDLQVRALAARVERAITRPFRLECGVVRIGISVGARIADAGEDATQVLRDADSAMYAIKSRRHARAAG